MFAVLFLSAVPAAAQPAGDGAVMDNETDAAALQAVDTESDSFGNVTVDLRKPETEGIVESRIGFKIVVEGPTE